MANTPYNVFLSYNSEDRDAVEKIAIYLADNAKLRPWFDQWELIPGESSIRSLERGMKASATCAVFVGKSGEGPWQKHEVEMALQQQVKNPDFRVIPVLLPDAPTQPELPMFLSSCTWIIFRNSLNDDNALWHLECGIRGEPPERGRPKEKTQILQPSASESEFIDGHKRRLIQQRDELQQEWELLGQKLFRLKTIKILETREDEKFRLEHQINDLFIERQETERQLNELEVQLISQSYSEKELETVSVQKPAQIFVCYHHREPDRSLAHIFANILEQVGHNVFVDTNSHEGTDWIKKIREKIERTDYFLLLLSREALVSETVIEEVAMAKERAIQLNGFPVILSVRIRFPLTEPLPYHFSDYLHNVRQVLWNEYDDTSRLVKQLLKTITDRADLPATEMEQEPSTGSIRKTKPQPYFDPRDIMIPGGALEVDSRFYIKRQEDEEVFYAVNRPRVLVTVRGSRQTGKTSLVMRVYAALQKQIRVAFIDFQALPHENIQSLDMIWCTITLRIAKQLQVQERNTAVWNKNIEYNENISEFFERFVFDKNESLLLICFDEVDRVLKTPIRSGFFASIRSFYNKGAIDSNWKNVRWLLVTSSEPSFFIEDLTQSPFNIGFQVELSTFKSGEVSTFARRHGLVLNNDEVDEIIKYVGGHPYLVHLLLYNLVYDPKSRNKFFDAQTAGNGIFRDHLHRYLIHFQQDERLAEAMRNIIHGKGCEDVRIANRLEAAGLVRRNESYELVPLCELYEEFFGKELK